MPTLPAKVLRFAGERAELDVPKEVVERVGLKPEDALDVFAPGGGVLVLAREAGHKAFLVGTLDALSVAEVLGFVASSLRSGTLTVHGPTARRRVVFSEGQIVFAASTELAERLGPVMLRHGMLTPAQLDWAEPKVHATAKLGKVLMDAGILTAAQLYRGMQLQVKEILFGAFVEADGEFALVDEGANPELNTVRLLERTRDLILEGMSRADEMAQLRAQYEPTGVPKRKDGPAPTVAEQLAVWQKVDGRLALRDVIRGTRLGEHTALKALKDLVAAGRIQPPPPRAPKAPASKPSAGRPQGEVGAVPQLKAAAEKIRLAIGAEAFRKLASWPASLAPAQQVLLEGVFRGEEIDFERLLANAQKAQPAPTGRTAAIDLAEGFLAFALFEARNVLAPGPGGELAREVGKALKGK